jgi:hypothetical protein
MIPKELIPHAAVLRHLARSRPKVLTKQIDQISPNVVKVLKNISKNVLLGRVKITKRQKARLLPHKKRLQELALRKTSLKKSRRLLKGGFLGTLLAPLLGILGKVLLT